MQYSSAAMEFVKFVLCIAVIVVAQVRAAPAGGKQRNAEFVLPELARKGFDMTVEATIDDKFKDDLKHKKLAFLRNSPSALCESESDDGAILCIVPSSESDDRATPNSFRILIKARTHNSDELVLKVWLNGSYIEEFATTYEDFKNVSIQGVIADIQTLHFNFMNTT